MTLLLTLLASLSLLASPAPGPSAPVLSPTTQPAAPIVLLVHGRGELGDTSAFRRESEQALHEAVRESRNGATGAMPELRVVWYADLLGDRGASGSAEEVAACAARRGEPEPLGLLTIFATSLLDLASDDGDSTVDTRARRALRGMLGDVRFLGSPASRCVAEGRVARALERATADARRGGRPVVLLAHSMGGLLAWGHLQARVAVNGEVPSLHRFVTVGSPVGSPSVRALLFGERDGTGTLELPRGVRSWTNVVHPDDPFAVPLLGENSALAPQSATAAVRDVHVTGTRSDPHALLSYLRDPATARAVMDGVSGRSLPPR